MANKKITPINYTSREFVSIKNELVEYSKRYYPDTYKDFRQASFGSLMTDMVSYVGDILSFYLDYQANESFLLTSIERKNAINNARSLGYKFNGSPSSSGIIAIYIAVPGDDAGPYVDYIPTLKQGAILTNNYGVPYILNETVDFSVGSEITLGQKDPNTGEAKSYIYKKYAKIISGVLTSEDFTLGNFKKFLKLTLSSANVVEIISVKDSEGNVYYEVDSLSQNIIYRSLKNNNSDKTETPFILKPVSAPRRFSVEHDGDGNTILQFGFGSDSNLQTLAVVDPSEVVLQQYGKDYVTDQTFDPNNLISTDKLGIAPSNTTLTVLYRTNDTTNVNSAVNSVKSITNVKFIFPKDNIDSVIKSNVVNSIEVDNEEPIVGSVSVPETEEIKIRALGYFAAQNRAVTKQDYISMIYNLPSKFGSIKRVNITQDKDSFKRNLNAYVVSEDKDGYLTYANNTTKSNLKNWILNYKMINDTIDILDAKIVNIGVDFEIIASLEKNKHEVLEEALTTLKTELFNKKFDIGESFYYSDVYNILNRIDGVMDTTKVTIRSINGSNYSQVSFDIASQTSADNRYVEVPENYILEIKFPHLDIRGVVK